jgi:hypothetical protein
LKDKEAIDWSKGFRSFHWTRETNSRKVMEAYQGRGYLVYVGKKKRGGGSVRKDLVLMCGKVFMEKVCARIKHGKKLCVASTCSKASGFLVQLVFPPKSIVGFVSNLNQI